MKNKIENYKKKTKLQKTEFMHHLYKANNSVFILKHIQHFKGTSLREEFLKLMNLKLPIIFTEVDIYLSPDFKVSCQKKHKDYFAVDMIDDVIRLKENMIEDLKNELVLTNKKLKKKYSNIHILESYHAKSNILKLDIKLLEESIKLLRKKKNDNCFNEIVEYQKFCNKLTNELLTNEFVSFFVPLKSLF